MKQGALITLLFLFSLSVAAKSNVYIDNGISVSKKIWNYADYNALVQALNEKKVPLPVSGSEESGSIFAAMVAKENLDFFQFYLTDKPKLGPIKSTQTALQYGGLLSQEASKLLRLYLLEPNGAVEYEFELAKMISFLTTVGANNIVVVNKFKDLVYEQMNEQQKSGLEQMKNGSITIMDGLITSIGETHYSEESLITMSAALESNIATYSELYDAEYNSVVMSRLEKLYNHHQIPSLRKSLKNAIEILKART